MKTFLSIILVCVATFWSLGSHAYTFSDLRDPLAAYFDARFEEALTAENIIPENVVYYQKEYDQKRASFLNLIDTYITTNTSVKRGFPKFAESLRNIMQYIDTFALQESEFVITQKSISTLAQAEVMEVQQVFVDTLRQYMYTLASDMHETGELQFEVHTKGFDLSVQSQLLDTYVSQDGNKARADIMLDIALDVRSEDGSKVRLDAIVGFEVISSFDEQYIYWHTFTYDVSGDDSLLPFSGEDTLEKADYFFDRYNDVFLRVTGEQDTFASPVVAPSALQTVLDIIYEQPLFVLDVATVGDEVLYLEPNAPTWNAIGDALGYDSVLFDLATVVSDVLHLEATLDLFDDGSVMDIQMKNTDIYGNLVIGNREVFMLDLFIQDIVAPDDENVTIHWEEGVFFLDFINDFWPILTIEWIDEYLRIWYGLDQVGEATIEGYLTSEQTNLEMYLNDFMFGRLDAIWTDAKHEFGVEIDIESLFPGTGSASFYVQTDRTAGQYPIDTPAVYIDWEGNF